MFDNEKATDIFPSRANTLSATPVSHKEGYIELEQNGTLTTVPSVSSDNLLNNVPLDYEIVLFRSLFSEEEIATLSKPHRLILERTFLGRAFLKVQNSYLAAGRVEIKEGVACFRIQKFLTNREKEVLIEKTGLNRFKIFLEEKPKKTKKR